MRKIFLTSALFLISLTGFSVSPDEGIWIPLLIEKYNIKLMQEKGFKLSADRNNKPADYSPDNIPYKPGFYFPISLKGTKEGDFTMVIGYPGSTSEYVSSYHIDMIKNYIDPKLIAIRTKKIEIIDNAMKSDPLISIQYSAKKAGISNSFKKRMGEIQGCRGIF